METVEMAAVVDII